MPPACAADINFSAMAAAQPRCGETQAAKRSASLQVVNQQVAGVSMWCDISTGKARPLVPACHRRQVFAALHGVVLPSIRAYRLNSHRFLGNGKRTDIANWCKDCQACQRSKTTRQPVARYSPSRCQAAGLATCTWTWLARSPHPQRDGLTSWPWWTDLPGGSRPPPCGTQQRRPARTPSSPPGWPGSAYQRWSLQTGGRSLPPRSGPSSAESWASNTQQRQPTNPRATTCLRELTASSRRAWKRVWPSMLGHHTSLGWCWAWGPRPRMTAPYPLPSWCTAPHWSSPLSSWTPPSRRPLTFWALAARPEFLPYQTPPAASTGDQQAAPAGVHQAQRCDAAAHAAVRRAIQGGRSRCEDLRGTGGRTTAESLRGQTQAAHGPRAGDGSKPRLPLAASEGADCSGCPNASHLRGSRCLRGLSVAILHSIVIVFII